MLVRDTLITLIEMGPSTDCWGYLSQWDPGLYPQRKEAEESDNFIILFLGGRCDVIALSPWYSSALAIIAVAPFNWEPEGALVNHSGQHILSQQQEKGRQ